MSSIGTGYDLSANTFSPDGRVFQVEYAGKAVENSGTAIGLRCSDGVVFGVEKIIQSKLYEPHSNPRNFTVERHIGLAFAGVAADARQLVNRARTEANNYRTLYGSPITCKMLSERVSGFVQAYTLYPHMRPFGTSVMLGSYDPHSGAQLYMIEPSGVSWGYFGCAIGKGRQAAKTDLEKLVAASVTCRQAVAAIAKIIYTLHDDAKDKAFQLEMSWVCEESHGHHQAVPADLIAEADAQAKRALEDDSDSEDDMEA
jgi:20S proteasome subunit alpha 7